MSDTLIVALLSLGAAVAFQVPTRPTDRTISLSPDGRRYLAMAADHRAPLPFALRWMLPLICGTSPQRWARCTRLHLALLVPLIAVWLAHWIRSPTACLAGALLVLGLPGIWRIHGRWPVLVDPSALVWTLGSAILALDRSWPAAIACVLVAASIKETAPVFAAVYGWQPLLLLGLLAPLSRRLLVTPAADPEHEDDILIHPFRAGWRAHRRRWLEPGLMLAPWGICLLAPLSHDPRLEAMLGLGLVLAYGQLLMAVDTVRLYQWAAPPAIVCTVTVLPPWALAAGLVLHLLNPWAGEGF